MPALQSRAADHDAQGGQRQAVVVAWSVAAMVRRKGKHASRDRDGDYMAWIKMQPCLLRGHGFCVLPVQADHAGKRIGYRAADDSCIPLCRRHHQERTEHSGFFRAMSRDERRRWRVQVIGYMRQIWALREQGEIPGL